MQRKLGVGFLVVGVLLVVAVGAGAAAPTDDGNSTQAQTEVIQLESLDDGTVYYVSGDAGLDGGDVPSGDYLATYYEDGERVTQRVTLGPGDDSVEPESHRGDSVRATVAKESDWSYPSDGAANIWVGTVNSSTAIPTPRPNVNLTVNVTRPDGTVDSLPVTTGSDGNANLSYSLAGKPDGQYRARITGDNVSGSALVFFTAGPTVAEIYPGFGATVEKGNTTTIAAPVTEDRQPVSGADANITIRRPDDTETTKQLTTDQDGYATFEFTPNQSGRYSFASETGFTFTTVTVGDVIGEGYINNDDGYESITTEQEANINGVLKDNGSAYANKQVFVEIVDEYPDETTVANISTTTDNKGQFIVTWEPTDSQDGFYDVRVNTSDGSGLVEMGDMDLGVRKASDGGGGGGGGSTPSGPVLDLDVEFNRGFSPVFKPGTNATATVTLTENGSAVSGENVTVGTYYDYDDVPDGIQTVTTNSSGMATVNLAVSPAAPDDQEVLVRGAASYNGSTALSGAIGEIQYYAVDEEVGPYEVRSGGTADYTLNATDPATGDPISGVPAGVAGETSLFSTTVSSTNSTETGADGTATASVSVPESAARRFRISSVGPYLDPYFYGVVSIEDYSVNINGVESSEYNTTETVSFNYTVNTGEAVSALVVIGTYDDVKQNVVYASRLDAGEQASFTIPSNVPDETDYRMEVRTISASGDTAEEYESFTVNRTTTPYNVTTRSTTSVTESQATLNGELAGLGGADEVELNFEYWLRGQKNSTYTFVNAETRNSTGPYNATVSGLDGNRTYVVQAVGYSDENGWITGQQNEFTTPPGYDVSTEATTDITDTSVTANGRLNGLGNASEVELNFEYWVKGQKNSTKTFVNAETRNSTGPYNATLSGLNPNETYVVQAVGYSDENDWTTGQQNEFTTAEEYNVSSRPTTDITDTSATARGELVGLGGANEVELNFEYWVKGQKNSTYTFVNAETRNSTGPYNGTISGLDPNTTYVIQAVGYTDENGWTTGQQNEFTTAEEYNVSTQSATNVTASSATLNGELVSLGGTDEVEVNFAYWVEGQKNSTYSWISVTTKTQPGSFSAQAESLDSNTTYVVRAVGYNESAGWAAGKEVKFTTD